MILILGMLHDSHCSMPVKGCELDRVGETIIEGGIKRPGFGNSMIRCG